MLEKSKDADNGEQGLRRVGGGGGGEGLRRDGEEGLGRTEVLREGGKKERMGEEKIVCKNQFHK